MFDVLAYKQGRNFRYSETICKMSRRYAPLHLAYRARIPPLLCSVPLRDTSHISGYAKSDSKIKNFFADIASSAHVVRN